MPHPSRVIATGLLAVLLLAGACAPQPQAPSEPQATASDTQRIERFKQQVEAHRDRLKIPGLAAVIVEDGQVLWTEGFGYADLENRIPATPDTLFHLASVTKTFTAILVLQLAEQGKLDLDEPVSHYSNDFKDDSVRIKHLLSHTSDGTPGERFSYNPERFEYLKTILEQKTGKPLRALFVETFLDPLGMQDSVPGPDLAKDADKWAVLGAGNLARYRQTLSRFAQPYTYYGNGEIVHAPYPPDDFWASAGLLSTVRDMAKYDAAVDRHALLKKETLAKAWTPFVSNAGQPLPMGLGWYVTDYRGTRLIWHYGHWGTGFSALYLKVPARRLSLLLLAHKEELADHHYQISEDVTNDLFACSFLQAFVPEVANERATEDEQDSPSDAASTHVPTEGPAKDCERSSRTALAKWIEDRRAKARKAITVDRAVLRTYAGRYDVPDRRVWTVTEEDGHLYVDGAQGRRYELFAETPDQFFVKIRPWTLRFVKEGARVTRLDITETDLTLQAPRVE
jgi:CubicO group peptidase (beta-lactamase class C family)